MLGELSDTIDRVEQVAKEYLNMKFDKANVRIKESRLLIDSREIGGKNIVRVFQGFQ